VRIVPFLLAVLAWTIRADLVLWEYAMDDLPPGWTVTGGDWWFQADGAHSHAEAEPFQEQWNELVSNPLVLPPGTDSVSIAAGQYSVTWETSREGTFSFTRMVLSVNGSQGIYWNVSGNQTDSLPIFVVPPAVAGDTLVVHLICAAVSFPDPPPPPPGELQAYADFHLWDFVVTAYGDLDLPSTTWASIKRAAR
jgi:hypothetical protein